MMLEFCYKYNCTWDIITVDETEWGVIYENKTGNGIIGAVVERRAEIGVGALYVWYHESLFLALSRPISRTGITCIVLKPKLVSGWFIAVSPFSTILWIAVLASIVIGIFVLTFVISIKKATTMTLGTECKFIETTLIVYKIYLWQSVKVMLVFNFSEQYRILEIIAP